MDDTPPDPRATYRAVRDELVAALRSIDEATAGAIVPACPAWSVKDVASHLSGLNAELLADVAGPLGSDEATARQVADRASLSLSEVLDEWNSLDAALHRRFGENLDRATALLADLVVHVYDLEELLAQPTVAAAAATPMSAHRYIPLLQDRVADVTQTALTITLDDGSHWPAPDAEMADAVAVETSAHRFLRGVAGRLTRADVEAFSWSADPSDILDRAWNQYGPFRT